MCFCRRKLGGQQDHLWAIKQLREALYLSALMNIFSQFESDNCWKRIVSYFWISETMSVSIGSLFKYIDPAVTICDKASKV